MSRLVPVSLIVLAIALVASATISPGRLSSANTPEQAVRSLYEHVKSRDWKGAFTYVSATSNVDESGFGRDLNGSDGSLRTYSSLQDVNTKVLKENDSQATVRTDLEWSSAVGAIYESRDLEVAREESGWKVLWPKDKEPNLPPQVIPVNYLRWDIVRRGGDEDWGAQNVEPPHVRIISMNPVERDGSVIIVGEVENEDTVPAFVAVNATLVGKDGGELAQESSFDKMSHTLLPKEVSPFRIDFPNVKLASVKSVRMQPNPLLVPASADPVIAVLHQRVETDGRGHHVLKGELLNESGQTVNIPHVLATYYDAGGHVVWVSDAYSDRALLPQTPVPFSVDVRDDLAANVTSYRVTVNNYTLLQQR
jgi:hypothetical protein